MKKLLSKIEIKPLFTVILLVVIQSLFYMSMKIFQGPPHLIGGLIDQKLGFCIYAIIPYCIWYLLLFIVPYYLYKNDKNIFYKYVASYLLCILLSAFIYVIYPTTLDRPEITQNGILYFITKVIYWIDTPAVNCLPSMHCALSMLFILSTFTSKKTSIIFKIIICILSISIMISTLLIKQHVLVDLITGDILMTICYLYVNYDKKIVNKTKKLLRI